MSRLANLDLPRRCTSGLSRLWAALCLLLWCGAAAAGGAACAGPPGLTHARVAYVYDGDTVKLADGRHVRFIGVNAPEIGHHGAPSQPVALQARRALIKLLSSAGDRVGLAYDRERYDRYHRTLAHIYVDGGRSVEAWLLQRGLATILIVPPNVAHARCYAAVERRARAAHRGLWHHARYRVTAVKDLSGRSGGYRIIRGRVTRIAHSRRSVWLHLGDEVELRVARADLPFMRPVDVERLLHREVIARGWLHRHQGGGGLWMRVRHSSALSIVGDAPAD